jgi:hypothetical protein
MALERFASGMRLTPARLNALLDLTRVVRKTSVQVVNNSTNPTADNQLVMPVAANAVYKVHLYLVYNSNATADFKYDFSQPTGASYANWTYIGGNAANFQTLVAPLGAVTALNGTGGDAPANAWGIFATSSTPGNLWVRWAQNTANASDTSVKPGSFLELVRIG